MDYMVNFKINKKFKIVNVIRIDAYNKCCKTLKKAEKSSDYKVVQNLIDTDILAFYDYLDVAISYSDLKQFETWYICLVLACDNDESGIIINKLNQCNKYILDSFFTAIQTQCDLRLRSRHFEKRIVTTIIMLRTFLNLTYFDLQKNNLLNILSEHNIKNKYVENICEGCETSFIQHRYDTKEDFYEFINFLTTKPCILHHLPYIIITCAIYDNAEYYVDLVMNMLIPTKHAHKSLIRYAIDVIELEMLAMLENAKLCKSISTFLMREIFITKINLYKLLELGFDFYDGCQNIKQVQGLVVYLVKRYSISYKKIVKYFKIIKKCFKYVNKTFDLEEFYFEEFYFSDYFNGEDAKTNIFNLIYCENEISLLFCSCLMKSKINPEMLYKVKYVLTNRMLTINNQIDGENISIQCSYLESLLLKSTSAILDLIYKYEGNKIYYQCIVWLITKVKQLKHPYHVSFHQVSKIVMYVIQKPHKTTYEDKTIKKLMNTYINYASSTDIYSLIKLCNDANCDLRSLILGFEEEFDGEYEIKISLDIHGNVSSPGKIFKRIYSALEFNPMSSIDFRGANTYGYGFICAILEKLRDSIKKELFGDNMHINYDYSNIRNYMKYYGMICGLCLYYEVPNIVPKELIKFCLGFKLHLRDVLPSSMIKNINSLTTLDDDIIKELELSPNVIVSEDKKFMYNIFDITTLHNAEINKSNIEFYIKSLKDYYVLKDHDSPRYLNFSKFKTGFDRIFKHTEVATSKSIYVCLLVNNNKKLITKDNVMEFIQFKPPKQKMKKILTRYVNKLSNKKFKKFLEFATGTKEVFNMIDNKKTEITISLIGPDEKLPISSTCSKTITMHYYSKQRDFNKDMNMVLDNVAGFELL